MRQTTRPMAIPALLALAALLTACGDESREAADDRAAVALLAEVRAADYPAWAVMPGYDAPQPSTGPHGQRVQIFVNRLLAEGLADGAPWPVGSVAVKDGWADGDLIMRSLIRRDADGWFFAQFDGADRIVASGADPMCSSCHDADRGYLLSAPAAE